MGPGCEVIGYADDIALLVSGYHMDVFTEIRLIPANSGGGDTFVDRGSPSRIDVMACSARMYDKLLDSCVLEELSGSDHYYLKHTLKIHSGTKR